MAKIDVKGTSITVVSGDVDDYISLTDIARYKDSDHTDDIIRNWLRNRNTLGMRKSQISHFWRH